MLLNLYLFGQYNLDTLSSRLVGPGTIHTKIRENTNPWTIEVLEVDLKNPFIKIESAKAKDKLVGLAKTTQMASDRTYDGHNVIGAVNADFFGGDGTPINIQIDNGEIVRGPISLSTIGIDDNNNPMIKIVKFDGKVLVKDTSVTINNVNSDRLTDNLILFNSFRGTSTNTNQWGTEILIEPINEWFANDTLSCIVHDVVQRQGNMTIPKGYAVLSGHGAAETFLVNKISNGDTIKLYLGVLPGLNKLKVMLGGYPKIVSDGVDYVDQGYSEEGGPSHTYERHPRTGVGFSKDSTKLFLVTVDGRGVSIGVTLPEFAKIMMQLGIHWGLNFDGGGSTTMVVRGKIENTPSDAGGERSVANAMLVVSSEPVIPTSLSISPEKVMVDSSRTASFSVDIIDQYNVPSSISNDNFSWTLSDPTIGVIDSMGVFKGIKSGSAKVIVEYLGVSDTAEVEVQIGSGYTELDAIENVFDWKLSGKNIDSLGTTYSFNTDYKTNGTGSVQVDYKYVYASGKTPLVYLEPLNEMLIYGIPDMLLLDGKSDSLKHKVYFVVEDANGSLFKLTVNKYFQRAYIFDTLTCPVKNFVALGENTTPNYPLSLYRIEIQLAGAKVYGDTYQGTFYIDNLRVRYPNATTKVENDGLLLNGYQLYQNYPNPFNPSTVISWQQPKASVVKLKLYDLLGKEICTLVNNELPAGFHSKNFSAKEYNLASGIYFYQLQSQDFLQTKKMILIQ